MTSVPVMPLDDVVQLCDKATIWTIDPIQAKVIDKFGKVDIVYPQFPVKPKEILIAIGGGCLIDAAKIWRSINHVEGTLVAVPSVWGSGAENSPIAIENSAGVKTVSMGEQYLPDYRSIWPQLADELSPELVTWACGDVWAHAIEAFWSPLATAELRKTTADLIKQLLTTDSGADPVWFELSARACNIQSQASVGLVHGIAHTLEIPMSKTHPNMEIGHARLCAAFLHPVLRFNIHSGSKISKLLSDSGLDVDRIDSVFQQFVDKELYGAAKETLESMWKQIVRDPSSRTNGALVRLSSISYFLKEYQ